jgi:hypothetical protein
MPVVVPVVVSVAFLRLLSASGVAVRVRRAAFAAAASCSSSRLMILLLLIDSAVAVLIARRRVVVAARSARSRLRVVLLLLLLLVVVPRASIAVVVMAVVVSPITLRGQRSRVCALLRCRIAVAVVDAAASCASSMAHPLGGRGWLVVGGDVFEVRVLHALAAGGAVTGLHL